MQSDIDPRTATPCRTVVFSADESRLIEANYLGFLTIRDAVNGRILSRFLGQTALVETLRFWPQKNALLLVGAGFEGYRDFGVVKQISFPDGERVREFKGHADDITDVSVGGEAQDIIASVGLDRRLVVHDSDSSEPKWIWDKYEDYLNMCAIQPGAGGLIAIAGDSPFTYVLNAQNGAVVAQLDTPGDCNGLAWSRDGRYLIVGDDHGILKYFDGSAHWKNTLECPLGGAIKKTVIDPTAGTNQGIAACYDGKIWTFPLSPTSKQEPNVIVERTRGMWGINVDATTSRIAAPSFGDRAFLFRRTGTNSLAEPIGEQPRATYGANFIALSPDGRFAYTSHDDGRIRVRSTDDGRLCSAFGGETLSLLMGVAIHPNGKLLASIDFYGCLWLYNLLTEKVIATHELPFGPGISLSFSKNGNYLAVGGYRWDGHVFAVSVEQGEHLRYLHALEKPICSPLAATCRLIIASERFGDLSAKCTIAFSVSSATAPPAVGANSSFSISSEVRSGSSESVVSSVSETSPG